MVLDALASEAMATLTTGVFLAGYAVELGASNAAIGILAAVPFAVQFLQLPAVALVERLRKRRAIATWAAGFGRSLLIAAAAAPFLGSRVGIIVLIVSVALYQAMAAIAGCAWNSWMRDLVPENEFGRFFGRRAAATTAVATALALVCGLLIDTWKRTAPEQSLLAYSAVFIVSAALGLFGVWLLSITPEHPMPPPPERTRIWSCWRHHSEILTSAVDGLPPSWPRANLAARFCRLSAKTLGYSMTMVVVPTTASQLSNPRYRTGGSLIDRFSNRVLHFRAAVPYLHVRLTTASPDATGDTLSAVCHPYPDGIATAGVSPASGNIAMKLSPADSDRLRSQQVVSASCAATRRLSGAVPILAAHQLTLASLPEG